MNQAEAQEAKRLLETNDINGAVSPKSAIRIVTHDSETYWLEWFEGGGDIEAGTPQTASSLREAEEVVAENYSMSWDEWKKQQTTPS